jgi:DNA-binding transcriptional regulator YdaS (Cro superfamily)
MTGIEQAVAVAGSQRNLAEMLGVTQQLVSYWIKQKCVPQRRIVEVEQMTGISRDLLIDPRLAELLSKDVS